MYHRRWVCVLLAMLLLATGVPLTAAADKTNAAQYTDNPVIAERLNRALEAFPVGSYFTYNGKPGTCHNESYCATEPYGCNCRRVVDGVDLYAWQCFGYARYVFYSCFGFLDTSWNESLYENVGSTKSGELTETVLKDLLSRTKTGAHIRIRNRHSMIFLNMDDDGFNVLHGNYDNHCGIYITHYTWSAFIKKYNAQGIDYIRQPKQYPGEDEPTIPSTPDETPLTDPTTKDPVPGEYRVTADLLYIRAGTGTQYDRVGSLLQDTKVTVTAVKNGWGQVTVDKVTGWISLEYAVLLKPSPQSMSLSWTGEGYFLVGDLLKATDVRVVVTYSDGSTALKNTGYELSYDFSKSGERPVTVTCKGLEATILATVKTKDEDDPSPPVFIKGDVNGDGELNSTDARLVLQYTVGKLTAEELSLEAADVDGSQTIDSVDARLILQMVVGKLPQDAENTEDTEDTENTENTEKNENTDEKNEEA